MDDEKKQRDGALKNVGNSLKQGANKLKKNAQKEFFKKVIATIFPILIYIFISIFAITVLLTAFADFLDILQGKKSKKANASAIDYVEEVTDETSPNRIFVDLNNTTKDGAYILKYEFRDNNGNLIDEDDAIKQIKKDLKKENPKLNVNQFTQSELKIAGALMYNGLQVEKYDEYELSALALFVKADIASKNFDLRSADKIGTKIDIDDIAESDYVYGTLQIHRTSAAEGYDSEKPLEYIPYGDEETPETFCYMEKYLSEDIVNKFSINEEGQAVFARISTLEVENVYKDKNGKKLSQAEIEQSISKENIAKNKNKRYVSVVPFEYKQFISQYIVSYGFLSDLLTVTENTDFCTELANLAFDSKIVINVKDELTVTDMNEKSDYIQTRIFYDYVDYQVSGKKQKGNTAWEIERSGTGNPNNNNILKQTYGWKSDYTPVSKTGNSNNGSSIYEWEHNEVDYKLIHEYKDSNSTWKLYKGKKEYINLNVEGNSNEFINLYNNRLKVEYTNFSIDEYYTDKEVFEYTLETNTHSESTTCSYEISEVDNWYIKFHKQYEKPVMEPSSDTMESSKEGKYSSEIKEVKTTTDENEINNVKAVKEFINKKEEEYKNRNSASSAECKVSSLTIKERVKMDSHKKFVSNTKKYTFGEEIVDTTEVQLKNIEYVNGEPAFTNEDDEEIGFLYIYDKYVNEDTDLFLDNDSENRLFKLLEEDTTTYAYSSIIKYLLYVYDGIDRGVTEFNATIVNIEDMNKPKGNSTENYIKMWENSALWEYERGNSTIPPKDYLTADEMFYIVYEDGSQGHNNISYGICTFISSEDNGQEYNMEWGNGYYNWADKFAGQGINVETLHEGALVDKEIVDMIFHNEIIPTFRKIVDDYLETNLPEHKFSRTQKDALIAVCYQYGNISGFADAYLEALNEDGTLDAEKMSNWSRFDFTTTNDRKYANWLLFTKGIYLDRAGNEVDLGRASIVEAAYKVADHFMNSGVDVHYSGGDSTEASANNGRRCVYFDIQGSWDKPIEQPDKYGVVCATFVTLALWIEGYAEEDIINDYAGQWYNATGGTEMILRHPNYKDEWQQINIWDELQEGDIVWSEGHVWIYMDGEKCLDQAYCVIGSSGDDLRGILRNASQYRYSFYYALRYIGK